MKIKAIQVGSISLPLVRPFKTALRTVEAVNDIVVRVIADDGSVGYGEAPPTAVITGDTTGSILCAVRDFIRPALVGMELDDLDAVQQGFDILKVKVGKEGLADVERMAAIRAAVGPEVKLRVDANQGWTAEQSVAIIRAMEDKGLDIELVEQPVPAHDLAGLRAVTAAVDTPILADEAVFSYYDAANLIEQKAADLINIKLMKTGGIHNALKICRMAEEHGIECMIGCMLESRLSVAAAAHLAAGQSIVTRADLDGPSLCSVDPYTGGPVFDGPSITMTGDPGVGVDNVPCDNWSD